MPIFKYGNRQIEYTLLRRKRKTVGIKIMDSAEIQVTCPTRLSNDVISRVVESKASWIISKLEQIESVKKELISKTYEDGEKITYLGNNYILRIAEWSKYDGQPKHIGLRNLSLKFDNSSEDTIEKLRVILNQLKIFMIEGQRIGIRFFSNEFHIYINGWKDRDYKKRLIKQALLNWYKEAALINLFERTYEFSRRYNLKPAKVSVKSQKTIWGSCSSTNNISYSWKLVLAPISIMDYVVVHELSHLVYRDHSANFWGLVEQIIPDCKEKRAWLKANGRSLDI
ncbi:MAG: SprT family zinc-dependent metalloprotease [Bacillota bacterium]|nr:SprT family zinc-dependent metalloprotease [Bacillota bacterium]